MDRKKRFAIKVAKKTWASELPIVVVHIPWDQFQAPGGPAAYALLIEGTGSIAVVVSKPAGGTWSSSTKIEKAWATISEATPLDSLEWHTMPIESDHYPWELFQR
jgi:hypothetical protein